MKKENVKIRSYEEKLQDLLTNKSYEPVEWRQSNEDVNGHTVSEVTFKFKQPTPGKEAAGIYEFLNTVQEITGLEEEITSFTTTVFKHYGGELIENPPLLSAITDLLRGIDFKAGDYVDE